MVDVLVGAEESEAKQLEDRKARLLECIATGKIGFVSTLIYTLEGTKSLQPADFGRIAENVVGVFRDDKRGFEDEGRDYLVVDCRGEDGFMKVRYVADSMARFLYHQVDRKGGRIWPGSWISSAAPASLPSGSSDTRSLTESKSHDEKSQLLRANPTRVTPLVFSK